VNSGDAWVEGPNGERFWGRFGAAGLLVHDLRRGVLLQHRADWSHFGRTWGRPGGSDLGDWSATTVGVQAVRAFEPHMADVESIELRWVAVPEVTDLPLHPGFGAAWPELRSRLTALVG